MTGTSRSGGRTREKPNEHLICGIRNPCGIAQFFRRKQKSTGNGALLILISSKSIRYPTTKSNTLNGFFGEVVDGHTEAVGNLFKCLENFIPEALGT